MLLLIALFCSLATALGQSINTPADFTEDGSQQVKLRARALVPMAPRPGDVNCDAQVTIADVSELIDMLLYDIKSGYSGADVNQDGTVSIADVSELIDMLLSGSDYSYDNAINDLNEIYRSMHTAGWSTTGNTHQCFGISAYNLMAEVMGDDMIMGSQGSGWFWFDARYDEKDMYTSTNWRSYDLWTAYYTWIANANYILEAATSMSGTTSEKNYVKGQAYAIRAYSYFMLAQSFARTYKGHESDPCVPLFTGLTFNGSTGAPRSTVAQVYTQIYADINEAVSLLNGTTQIVPDHIGYAVALGLKARIALVKEDWETAYNAASNAIAASGKSILPVSDFVGLNDAYAANVMWGADIPAAESGMYASLFSHMSISVNAYGIRAPKQISLWLYNKMSATDARLAWWDPSSQYSTGGYVQTKFDFSNPEYMEGDYIWMRIEEMYLSAAEAALRAGMQTNALEYLTAVMSKRDPNYHCTKTGTELGALTTDETGSLLEEILIQRRLELWGEDGRIYTIRRLRQGFERTAEDGWPSSLLLQGRSLQDPESYPWVLTIPASEFAGNDMMSINTDQNPIGDYPEEHATEPQNVTFVNVSQTEQNPDLSYTVYVPVRRATTEGDYYATVKMNLAESMNGHVSLGSSGVVHFSAGEDETKVLVNFYNMEMGHEYYADLSFSQADIDNTDPALGSTITATRIVMRCENGNPTGQNISFESATIEETLPYTSHTIPVTIVRDATDDAYAVRFILSEDDGHETLLYDRAVFNKGKDTFTAYVDFEDMTFGQSYSCVLTLVPDDGSASDPAINGITSVRITFNVQEQWVSAGTCTFIDYTWTEEENGTVAYEVPVQRNGSSNAYRIVAPWYYVYSPEYGDDEFGTENWNFTLNSDGSITPVEGVWDLNYYGYFGYYSSSLPSYCFIDQNNNTYDVNFVLQKQDTGGLYQGGHFTFTWDR